MGQWDLYLTFHSYGNWWFTPWGFTHYLPYDYPDLIEKAHIATRAIKSVNGIITIIKPAYITILPSAHE
jgi:hypothetical protein